jgi:hypothetical protein
MRLFEVDQVAATAWAQTLSVMLDGVRSGSAQIEQTRSAASQSLKQLELIGQRLRKLKLLSAVLPEVPTIDHVLLSARRNRVASVNLLLALFLLPPIVYANAQLTGLVLRELIPPVQPILGVPVPYAIALIIVIAEVAIGLLHSAEAEQREDSERKLTLATLVTNVAALGVIAIETLLYAQVQPESTALKLPIGGSAFGLVGALLGFAVFGLGRLAHNSVVTLRKDRTPKAITKHLLRLKDAADQWNLVAERLEPSRKAASDQFERLIELCRRTSEAQGHAMQQFINELATHRESPPPWARPTERTLTRSEFADRESRTYFWVVIAALAAASLTMASLQFARNSNVAMGAVVAIGLTVGAFAMGAFGSQNAPFNRRWRLTLQATLLLIVVALAVASGRLLRGAFTYHSVVISIPAVAAYIAGHQIGPMAPLLKLPMLWIAHRSINGVVYLAIAVLWLFAALTAVIEYIARVLAWPMTTLIRAIKSRREPSPHATIA